jgi:hypothetical protein
MTFVWAEYLVPVQLGHSIIMENSPTQLHSWLEIPPFRYQPDGKQSSLGITPAQSHLCAKMHLGLHVKVTMGQTDMMKSIGAIFATKSCKCARILCSEKKIAKNVLNSTFLFIHLHKLSFLQWLQTSFLNKTACFLLQRQLVTHTKTYLWYSTAQKIHLSTI